jgi:hypothetical protein
VILKHLPRVGCEEANSFSVLDNDTLTKQQYSDREIFNTCLLPSVVSLRAQLELESAAGYIIEDDRGQLHRVNYRQYTNLGLDKLFLPPIELPLPSMTIEQAMIEMVKFANYTIEKELHKVDAFILPKEFVMAREVLGGREAGMQIFNSLVQVFKTRK